MNKIYTTLQPSELWQVFTKGKIYKGGGSSAEPKMVRQDRLRAADFDIRPSTDGGPPRVYPNREKGLSFSGSVERLERLGIEGVVWEFEFDSSQTLPYGLVVNFSDPDRPLINVAVVMTEQDVIASLNALGALMRPTSVKIKRAGVR
jgi:hypothetical protein